MCAKRSEKPAALKGCWSIRAKAGRYARRLGALSTALLLWACEHPLEFEAVDTSGMRWFKGNTHTHTLMSDGDSTPEFVARWYKDHGYQFLIVSDHDVFVDPATLASLQDSTFLLIPGEGVTSQFQSKPVHVNGLNMTNCWRFSTAIPW